jgi:zinc D-Ala-D-Ala carboxypeptidase
MGKLPLLDRIPCCPHSVSADISPDLVVSLERVERDLGVELVFSSGFRCPECNAKVGGVSHSAHQRGLAVDIAAGYSSLRYALVKAFLDAGWRRIGIGKTFIHVDIDLSLPQDIIWHYYDTHQVTG